MFLVVIHLIAIAVCLVLKVLEVSTDTISFFFAIVSSIIFVIYATQLKGIQKQIKLMIIAGFLLRIILVVIDVFIIRLPETGYDDADFYRKSVWLYNNGYQNFSQNIYGGFFTKILSVSYYIIGPSRLSAQYINVLFFAIAMVLFAKALVNFNISSRNSAVVMFLICFMPNAILHNSILRRETIIELFVCGSIFFFSKWRKNARISNALLAILFMMFASLFHTVFIFGALILSLYLLLYNKQKERVSFSVKNMGKLSVMLVIVLMIGVSFLSMFNNKFSSLDSMDDVYTAANRARGGSVYLQGYEVNSVGQLILFTPLKLFFFLFSPVPWMFRNAMDIILFILDALVYIVLIVKVFSGQKTTVPKLMMTLFVTISIIFALGTFNSGTAIRHRFSVLPFLLVAYATSNEERDKRTRKKALTGNEEAFERAKRVKSSERIVIS